MITYEYHIQYLVSSKKCLITGNGNGNGNRNIYVLRSRDGKRMTLGLDYVDQGGKGLGQPHFQFLFCSFHSPNGQHSESEGEKGKNWCNDRHENLP